MFKIRKIDDRIVAGIIAGVGANLVKTAIEHVALNRGISRNTGVTKAAGFFMPPKYINTPLGRLNGWIADNSIAAFLGICKSYLFSFSGKDYSTIKGIAMGDIAWSLAYGVMSRMGASSLRQEDPKTAMTIMVSHAAFGLVSAMILRNIASPRLFMPPLRSNQHRGLRRMLTPQVQSQASTENGTGIISYDLSKLFSK